MKYQKQLRRRTSKAKTIEVNELKDWINSKLESPFVSQDVKRVYCGVLEEVLTSTRNYNGFNNLFWIQEGYSKWTNDNRPYNTDGTIPSQYSGEEYTRLYY